MKHEQLLDQYLMLVLAANKRVNLTSVDDLVDARLIHLEDSIAALPEVQDCPEGMLVDLGTGAGFPGVPLAVESGRKAVLIEAVAKKAREVTTMVGQVGLSNLIEVYPGRAEEFVLEDERRFSCLVARAVSALPSLLELSAPLLNVGGRAVYLKTPGVTEELEQALAIQEKLGMAFLARRDYVLSDGETERSIVVFEKVSEPSVKLPRRVGMAQKRPFRG